MPDCNNIPLRLEIAEKDNFNMNEFLSNVILKKGGLLIGSLRGLHFLRYMLSSPSVVASSSWSPQIEGGGGTYPSSSLFPSQKINTGMGIKSEAGYTIVEMLVSGSLGILLLGLIVGSSVASRNNYRRDLVRARSNESLRGVIDIIAGDARLGGENLGSAFPAIEVVNSGTNDSLIIRRNLLGEVLPLCSNLTMGSSTNASFAIPGSVAGCTYSGQTSNYNAWRSYRITQSGIVDAYIWDSAAKLGEFFKYTNDQNTGTGYSITRSGTWSRAYPATSTSIYMLEEWRFQKIGTSLQLITNQDFVTPADLAFNITAFDMRVDFKDGTNATSLSPTGSWTNIKYLTGTFTSSELIGGVNYPRTLNGYFFPRNVLSN